MVNNIDDLEKIASIVEKHNLSYFEFEQDNTKIIMDRKGSVKAKSPVSEVPKEDEIPEDNNAPVEKVEVEKDYIKSSLTGTFYSKREEGAEPFTKLHDVVKEDTVVGLIEVMKLFNEIEAGVSGEIVDVLVKDGDFVEYGQPLFEIKSVKE